MNRQAVKESLQKQIQMIRSELTEINLSSHLLTGPKRWSVTDSKTEIRKKELSKIVEEYQRILTYTLKSS